MEGADFPKAALPAGCKTPLAWHSLLHPALCAPPGPQKRCQPALLLSLLVPHLHRDGKFPASPWENLWFWEVPELCEMRALERDLM